MTEKNKEKGMNIIISTIVSISIVFLSASLSGKAITEKDLKDKVDCKADITYVDKQNAKQDAAIIEVKTLFLFEVQELRKDLRLKAEKK